jgi:hypothetical protein
VGGHLLDRGQEERRRGNVAQVGASDGTRLRARGRVCGSEHDRLKALERENRELKRANEILRKAAAFFA